MAPATGSAAAAVLLVVAVVLLTSPGARSWGWGESCMEECLSACVKKSEELEESKKLNATQCKAACDLVCPIAYLMGTGVKPEDIKPPPADDTPQAAKSAAAARKNGWNVYVRLVIHVAFATLRY